MAKKYFIYQGYIHEINREGSEEKEVEESTQDKDLSSNMKLSPDRMYNWLVKKAELFGED